MMKTIRFSTLLLFAAGGAFAQSSRTFVSVSGSDAAACSRTAPCRSFNVAMAVTNIGGEVVALDSGGYGPFNVITAITVEAPQGVYAGVTATAGDAIVVNTPPSDFVRLKGLTIVVTGSATRGIVFFSGGELSVEQCSVKGGTTGIAMSAAMKMTVIHSSVSNVNGFGVSVSTGGSTARAVIEDSVFSNNVNGVNGGNGSNVLLSNSTVTGSGGAGAQAVANPGLAVLVVENCRFSGNGTAVLADSSPSGFGTAYLSQSTITGNASGIRQNGAGVFWSRTNNTVEANGTNTAGTIGTFAAQ